MAKVRNRKEKVRMKKLVALAAVLAIAMVVLTACGSSIVGTWKLDTTGAVLPEGTEQDLWFEFKSDKTYTAVAFGQSRNGTYAFDQDNSRITLDGESYECILNGNRLTITMNGEKMSFTKK